MSRPSLVELAVGTDKEQGHNYCSNFYDEAFAPYRDRPVRLLEIGVQAGGSLVMWLKYFEQGEIHGLDKSDNADHRSKRHHLLRHYLSTNLPQMPRLRLHYGNAYLPGTAWTVGDGDEIGFDIIIDDGSHTAADQKMFLQLYLPLLRQGGVAVIEDVADERLIPQFRSLVPTGWTEKYVDLRQIGRKCRDNQLFAAWRP